MKAGRVKTDRAEQKNRNGAGTANASRAQWMGKRQLVKPITRHYKAAKLNGRALGTKALLAETTPRVVGSIPTAAGNGATPKYKAICSEKNCTGGSPAEKPR